MLRNKDEKKYIIKVEKMLKNNIYCAAKHSFQRDDFLFLEEHKEAKFYLAFTN